jgi:hypothetical protein
MSDRERLEYERMVEMFGPPIRKAS